MHKKFSTLEELYLEMDRDKDVGDIGVTNTNRYPVRFILFEHFSEFYEFVCKSAEKGVHVVGIEKWLDTRNRDTIPTYSLLYRHIADYISQSSGHDAVIAPFSELARFYSTAEFKSLVTSIRLKEANKISQEKHLRIYIPLIGMQGKMDTFRNDNEIHVWEFVSTASENRYRLVLCRGTNFGIPLDGSGYLCCNSVLDWIALWKQGEKVSSTIICCSKSIFDFSGNAQPDNAFDYTTCHNAFEFLQDGLKLIPKDVYYKPEDLPHWEKLASEIKDTRTFEFETYVLQRFNVIQLEEAEFMQFWFKKPDSFSRWLLKTYYLTKFCHGKYLCRALAECETTQTNELFEKLALLIFSEGCNSKNRDERRKLLSLAEENGVKISNNAEGQLKQKLVDMAENPECGYSEAMKYMTPLTKAEKQLMVTWLGQGKINRDSLASLLPDLYAYTAPLQSGIWGGSSWLEGYFDEYRRSKIGNTPMPGVGKMLRVNNDSSASFETWRNTFKTVKTILANREDVEVYYWIDGLGVDWLPFITSLVNEYRDDGVYLNEIYIATVQLPTTTAVNKQELESLKHATLEKIGDIDTFAHKSKTYPNFIYEELQLVRKAVTDALKQHAGRKIAFVSDHGISYLAQHGKGLSLAGASGEHAGRCATWKKGNAPHDNKYTVATDGKTICSLTHNSLADKTPSGQGAHGGATPEEVLVPVIIVSGQENASNYTALLLQKEISASSPVARYEIKGVHTIDVPVLKYNGQTYALNRVRGNIYESERLQLQESASKVTLVIGGFTQSDSIVVKTGADEINLFEDL